MTDKEPREEIPRSWARIFSNPEGRLLAAGLLLAALYVAALGLGTVWAPSETHKTAAMTVTHVFFGRAAGMSFGYATGLSQRAVIPVNMLIETILLLLFYPLFVLSWRRLVIVRSLQNMIERTRRAAEAHRGIIRRLGIPGLFVFVWFPFWMTGPLVGSILGYLLGLRSWVNLGVVLAGTYVAIASWAILLHQINERLAAYSSYAPILLVAIVVAIVVIGNIMSKKQDARRDRR